MNRLRLIVIWALIALVSLPASGAEYTTLTILHTNDIHGRLFPFTRDGESIGGYARHSTIFSQIRSNSQRVLLLSAGDTWNRGPLDYLNGEPDISAMNKAGYDVWTLGNGEFYAGVGNIIERTAQARFPCLSANVRYPDGGLIVRPFVVKDVDGVQVGIFGLTAPRIVGYPSASHLEVVSPIDAAKDVVSILRDKVAVLIALTHIGLEEDKKLAAAIPEIDIIVGGDCHTELHKPFMVRKAGTGRPLELRATPILQAGDLGRFVGLASVYLRRESESDKWTVVSADGELIPVNESIASCPEMVKLLEPYLSGLDTVVGYLDAGIPRREGLSTPLPDLMARFVLEASEAQIGIYNHGGVQEGLPRGQVKSLDIAYALPFANRLLSAELTAPEIIRLIQQEPSSIAGADIIREESGDIRLIVGGREAGNGETYKTATSSWQMIQALGEEIRQRTVDHGDLRHLFEEWFAETAVETGTTAGVHLLTR